MHALKPSYTHALVALSLLAMFFVRDFSTAAIKEFPMQRVYLKDTHFIFDKVTSGPLVGLRSDFKLLDVFGIYYDAQRSTTPEERMALIKPNLLRAQNLDPKFYDVYRMASSVLAYDAKDPNGAIELLRFGINARPDLWEIPYYAGFIAHDLLKDDKLAFELMSQVQINAQTPPIVVTLASRFLASSSTTKDAILFLSSMLLMMPIEYQEGIRQRIDELENGKYENNKR